jgi:hypothetical protein
MIRFRAFLYIVAVALLAGGWLSGQTSGTKGQRLLPPYWSKLGLSDDQKTKAQSVVSEYRKKIDALKQQIGQLEAEEKDPQIA